MVYKVNSIKFFAQREFATVWRKEKQMGKLLRYKGLARLMLLHL